MLVLYPGGEYGGVVEEGGVDCAGFPSIRHHRIGSTTGTLAASVHCPEKVKIMVIMRN